MFTPTPKPSEGIAREYTHFDMPEVQLGYVVHVNEDEQETVLVLEGVTGAACLWPIEQRL